MVYSWPFGTDFASLGGVVIFGKVLYPPAQVEGAGNYYANIIKI